MTRQITGWTFLIALALIQVGIGSGAEVEVGALPDPGLTPGATLNAGVKDLCAVGYSKRVRRVPSAVRIRVYNRYHRMPEAGVCCEVDHLIPLELGGSNEIANLWPQPYNLKWNAHLKDTLETFLHKRVCSGQLSLREAQLAIAKNWIEAYRRYRLRTQP